MSSDMMGSVQFVVQKLAKMTHTHGTDPLIVNRWSVKPESRTAINHWLKTAPTAFTTATATLILSVHQSNACESRGD